VTCQVISPNLTGYRPYCPYTLNPGSGGSWSAPDIEKTRALVRASGTVGARVAFWFFSRAAVPDQASAAALWTKIDRDATDLTAIVPTYTPRSVDLVSKRVGNYEHHPLWGVLLDQLWVR